MFFDPATQDLWLASQKGAECVARRLDPSIRAIVRRFFGECMNWANAGPLALVEGYIGGEYGGIRSIEHIVFNKIAAGFCFGGTHIVGVSPSRIEIQPRDKKSKLDLPWSGTLVVESDEAMVCGNFVYYAKLQDRENKWQVAVFRTDLETGDCKMVRVWQPSSILFNANLCGEPWYSIRPECKRGTEIWHQNKKLVELERFNRSWEFQLADSVGRYWLRDRFTNGWGVINRRGTVDRCIRSDTDDVDKTDYKPWTTPGNRGVGAGVVVSPCGCFLFYSTHLLGKPTIFGFAIREDEGHIWLDVQAT